VKVAATSVGTQNGATIQDAMTQPSTRQDQQQRQVHVSLDQQRPLHVVEHHDGSAQTARTMAATCWS